MIYLRLQVRVAETDLLALSQDWIVILMIINVLLLVVGMFIEAIAAMIILVPILTPVAAGFGICGGCGAGGGVAPGERIWSIDGVPMRAPSDTGRRAGRG